MDVCRDCGEELANGYVYVANDERLCEECADKLVKKFHEIFGIWGSFSDHFDFCIPVSAVEKLLGVIHRNADACYILIDSDVNALRESA